MRAALNFSLEARPPAPAPRKRPCTDTQSEYSTHIYLARLTFRLTPVCDCHFVIPIYRDRTLTKLVAANVRGTQLDFCLGKTTKNAAGCSESGCLLSRVWWAQARGRCISQDLSCAVRLRAPGAMRAR